MKLNFLRIFVDRVWIILLAGLCFMAPAMADVSGTGVSDGGADDLDEPTPESEGGAAAAGDCAGCSRSVCGSRRVKALL